MGSTTPYSLKAVLLEQLLRVGKADGRHIPRTEVKDQKPQISWSILWVKLWSCPLGALPQYQTGSRTGVKQDYDRYRS